ncbi:hypothetical protein [Streptomyces sp. I05A-00742]|uniref:hypothetical protein n=1 Tax=Streptomyces sp. I05A-00742 TaxID=2732853 RepID=UPI001488DB70|nr:hypothetical protein [Streptomyces sp. I05A-00742]
MTSPEADDKASEGTWALALLALVPTICLTFLTDLATFWYVTAWVFWGLSALLLAAGWAEVVRHGARGATGWTMCTFAHGILAWQAAHLVT